MVRILQTLTVISLQMQTFDNLEHTARLMNACIYYEITVSILMIMKKII